MKSLFFGGKILTMEEPMYAEAVLIENGKILSVGSKETLTAAAGPCEQIDLKGSTLMPGFIDPHSHFFQVAMSLTQVSLSGVDNVLEIERRISAFIQDNHLQPGQWINARDYDHNEMPELKNPTIQELDRFAPDNPLVIHHKSGHMGLMNSLALKELTITAETKPPEGGRIEVIHGKLTGYLEENAFFEALKKIPMTSPQQMMEAFAGAQKKYASYGITTVQDGMVVQQMLPLYELMLQKKLLNIDVILYSSPETYQTTENLIKKYPYNTHLKSGGMKIFLDGSPQGRTAWMRKPYVGEDTYRGYPTMTDEAVESAFALAADYHTQIICHCNGDAAAEQFLRCIEKTEHKYPYFSDLRPVLIHGQLIGTDQIPKAAELGAMISFFAAHVYHWGDVHIRNFGMERASQISPARSARDAGVKFTFHQDAPVIEPDMLETLWCAVNRMTKKGVELGAEQKISVLDALKAVTVNAAYQYFEEDQKGTIRPGKQADFVILNENPMEIPSNQLRKIQVLYTYKDGKCIYDHDAQ